MPDLLVPESVATWGPRRVPVPYAAHWTGEKVTASRVVSRVDGAGIRYVDETAADRDAFGVLWGRLANAPGAGRPDFRSLHPARQRHTQAERLCQVCAKPASHNRDGWLFLVNEDEASHDAGGQHTTHDGTLTTKPPVCLPCARLAVQHCPHLTHPLGVRARRPRIWGVFGTFYTPTPEGRLRPHHDHHLPYGHRALAWFLASQLVTELKRCTTVDLTAEFRALS
ncbi:hypothetical protein [Streptomyces sedi]|uniref:Uncharacterized protein n=1 Tax=Streptomyces sedi TaxID=555059 RepID=A0A5C4UZV4_9ACTN|nr:hypothetical protein [Streptomyces sedi]TNM29087.1 hypothetical protein FH715_16165 [Streptomyces sedi]